MPKMNVRQALAGVMGNANAKKRSLERQSAEADLLRGLMLHKGWPVMLRVLDRFKREAVQELGTKGMMWRLWWRVNHRMELLNNIDYELLAILNQGDQANAALAKIKEKSDGR